ncbi:unnamed protein product [Brassica oleracea]
MAFINRISSKWFQSFRACRLKWCCVGVYRGDKR